MKHALLPACTTRNRYVAPSQDSISYGSFTQNVSVNAATMLWCCWRYPLDWSPQAMCVRDYLRCKSKLGFQNFLVQNSLSTPTKYLRNVGLEHPTWKWKFAQILALWIWVGLEYPRPHKDLCGSWCVETNRCIPQGYRLVRHVLHNRGRCTGIWQGLTFARVG